MKYLIYFLSVMAAVLATGASAKQKAVVPDANKTTDLSIEMRIAEIVPITGGGFRIRTREAGNLAELDIVIPAGETKKSKESYEFPIVLESSPEGRKAFDQLTSKAFGDGKIASLFKRGYVAGAIISPKSFVESGGAVNVADVAIEGPFYWDITLTIDSNIQSLKLVVRRLRY